MIRATSDEGFTLVELVVYILILAVVMAAAGTLLIQTLTHQQNVRDTAEANMGAQLAFKALETDVRSAAWALTSQGGNLIVMQVRTTDDGSVDEERCVGYFLNQTTGNLHRTMSTSGTETQAALAAGDAAAAAAVAADWPVMVTDAGPHGGALVFAPSPDSLSRGDDVSMSLEVTSNADWPPVVFEKSISIRPQSSAIKQCY